MPGSAEQTGKWSPNQVSVAENSVKKVLISDPTAIQKRYAKSWSKIQAEIDKQIFKGLGKELGQETIQKS